MSGILYDLTKIKGVVFDVDGVLSPSTIPMTQQGDPQRMINIKDGYALQLAAKSGIKMAILSGGKADAIRLRYQSLGLRDIFMGVPHKLPVMEQWLKDNDLEPAEVAYVGDDIPDLKVLRHVGLPCCPHDACAEVKETCTYISRFDGGYGCVRDILEQILKAHGLWLRDQTAFGW